MEIKTPRLFSMSFIKPEVEIEKEYEDKASCIKHGLYNIHVVEYKDGYKSAFGSCPECEKEKTEEEERIQREKEKSFREKLEIQNCECARVKPDYIGKTLDDYIPETKAQTAAKEAVAEMIEKRKGKIVILGNNGVGKTMLGSIAAKSINGKIYTMYEIATRIRQSYSSNKETELDIVTELSELPLLVIDEIGRVKNSEAIQDWFSYILDQRHSNHLPFILLGNLHFKKDCKEENGCSKCFENYFDTDVLSRLYEDSVVINIKHTDNRKKNMTIRYISD